MGQQIAGPASTTRTGCCTASTRTGPAQAAEVHINGALAGTIGRMRLRPVWTWLRDVYAAPVPPGLSGRSAEIALRVWATPVGVGAAVRPSMLGTAPDVERIVDLDQQNQWVAKIPDWAVDILGVAVGLFSLGLFLLRRHAREYAYAAVFLCGFPVGSLYVWVSQQTGASFPISLSIASFAWSVPACLWLLFIWEFMRLRAIACSMPVWPRHGS